MGKKSVQHNDLQMPFRLRPGTLVVFEGLDGTGKSTQHERMEGGVYRPTYGTPMFDGEPLFLHMPSGSNLVGSHVYEMTEALGSELDPLARQLLHLASHAQELDRLRTTSEAVFLDRFWWSTVAYGWHGVRPAFSRTALARLAERVWRGIEPDVIFMFDKPHVEDPHNTPDVIAGYEWLEHEYHQDRDCPVFHVPFGTEAEQNLFILEEMARLGLYGNGA